MMRDDPEALTGDGLAEARAQARTSRQLLAEAVLDCEAGRIDRARFSAFAEFGLMMAHATAVSVEMQRVAAGFRGEIYPIPKPLRTKLSEGAKEWTAKGRVLRKAEQAIGWLDHWEGVAGESAKCNDPTAARKVLLSGTRRPPGYQRRWYE
jgi:hypothetical protein